MDGVVGAAGGMEGAGVAAGGSIGNPAEEPWTRVANPRRVTVAEDEIQARPEGGLDGAARSAA
ncbi:hypothetical protein [Demequina pelophila]|uniref:hypothetical protein n=1 Tax=Demequina pelophila TaxID=1638984 RepID=UPI0012E08B33|nr:hypothetical protein [Demequina pelophila]